MRRVMAVLIYISFLFSASNGYSFSIRESIVRGQRPEALKSHNSGPVAALSREDIAEAIEFGKANKHRPEVIKYAFMLEKDNTPFLGDFKHIYVLVCTNYFLIAQYVATQTKNYDPIDMDYVNFLSKLPAFKIEVVEQISPNGVSQVYPTWPNYTLLKNGEKANQIDKIPLYKGADPYAKTYLSDSTPWQERVDKVIRDNQEMARQISGAYGMTMPVQVSGITDHVYSYGDIDLNAQYEVAVLYSNGEKRVKLDLSKIK